MRTRTPSILSELQRTSNADLTERLEARRASYLCPPSCVQQRPIRYVPSVERLKKCRSSSLCFTIFARKWPNPRRSAERRTDTVELATKAQLAEPSKACTKAADMLPSTVAMWTQRSTSQQTRSADFSREVADFFSEVGGANSANGEIRTCKLHIQKDLVAPLPFSERFRRYH